ncbi:transcription termination factor NusA [Arcobacter sp. FWKO B]|uniref:transcription termination factor NusA n=1 Tax=Arcobacter sp. FWKO B TaxID=2593672 RepID=UPI0018A4CF35|nr:transcription termination factor NusA [Arcobacter sp. FWKO B]QOG12674.1 transcription termination/antitermination protein NusA [Arcobacter sp. FWKO B]
MDKIIDIIDSIAYEKGLKVSDVEVALKDALIKTAKKMINPDLCFDAEIDRPRKRLKLFQKIEVVPNDSNLLENENKNFISLDEAKKVDSSLDVGDFLEYDLEFEHLGRNAATILHSNLEYNIQRYLEENLLTKYKDKVGKIVSGNITYIDKSENTYIEIGEVKGVLPRKNRIKGEHFKVGDVIKAVVKSVNIDKAKGLMVEISRTTPKFLEALLKLEVPELKDEKVIIEASARIPGERAKIALSTTEANVDPIGAVVGVKGVRINAVSSQLKGENIDCVEYSAVPEIFISRALSPAIVKSVQYIKPQNYNEKAKAIVTITADQKSKAIGKSGLNIRLASMLTKTDIEINEIEAVANANNDSSNINEERTKDTTSLEALFK